MGHGIAARQAAALLGSLTAAATCSFKATIATFLGADGVMVSLSHRHAKSRDNQWASATALAFGLSANQGKGVDLLGQYV